jgi:glutathione S-transferase
LNKAVLPAQARLIQAQTKEAQDDARGSLYDGLKKFAEKIKGPYFLGEEFSLVDIAIAPWIARDYIPAEARGFRRSEVGEVWENYAAHIEKRESLKATLSVRLLLLIIRREEIMLTSSLITGQRALRYDI